MTTYISPNEARSLLRKFGMHRTSACIRMWCEGHPEFAVKRAGRWFVDRAGLLGWLRLDVPATSEQEAA